MNVLRRAITAQPLLSAHSYRKRLLPLYPISIVHLSSLYSTSRAATTYATTKYKYTPKRSKTPPSEQLPSPSPSPASISDVVEKEPVDWARPGEIPYQAKVANSVNLIGHVQIPVQFKATEDGNFWAGTIIAQQQSSHSLFPPVWIPVVFEGDLAHIAKCHLKENDYVYIAGELCIDQPPLTLSQGQTNVQVIAHSLNFIEVLAKSTKNSIRQAADVSLIQSEKLKDSISSEPISLDQKATFENFHQKKTSHSDKPRKKGNSSLGTWRDLLQDPKQWCDYRERKRNGLVNSKHPDFKHKDSGDGLWLSSAPGGVLAGLGGLNFDVIQVEDKKDGEPWEDLVANPDKWWDNRSNKVSERSPDFKHKESGRGLWLSDSPTWVSSSLSTLEAKQTSLPPLREKQYDASGQDGDFWKDLVENPKMWWDNRSNKLNPKSPDFKHKDKGKGLWLTDAPAWALPGLPLLKGKETDAGLPPMKGKEAEAGVIEGGPWKDLVENPEQWRDNRSNKLNPKAPDFKHKDTAKALWLSDAPAWALRGLPPLTLQDTDGGSYQKIKKETDAGGFKGDLWKDLVENPKNWWDNRSKKVNQKAPDFKHKETAKALWLSDAPEWALSSLPPLKAKKTGAVSEMKTWGPEAI